MTALEGTATVVEVGIEWQGGEIDAPYDTIEDAAEYLADCRAYYEKKGWSLDPIAGARVVTRHVVKTCGPWEPVAERRSSAGES